jgi:hypothetical protein
MIRKIIALCIVLMAVSTAFTGCKNDPEPTTPTVEDVENAVEDAGGAAKEAVDEHAGHDHD